MLKRWMKSAAVAIIGLAAVAASAQEYPTRPIKLVVPWPAGGPTDILARIIGNTITKRTGQAVVVENRPGGQTTIGMQAVAAAPPDGYTLGFNTSNVLSLPATMEKVPFDPVKDFTAITKVIEGAQYLTVSSSVPATNLQEFIAYAKANPGKLNWGSAGGPLPNLLFNQAAGVDIPIVPYKSVPEIQQAMLTGAVQVNFDNYNNANAMVTQGKARILATHGQNRTPELPNVPAFGEVLPKAAHNWWMYLYGPAGLPPAIVAKLHGLAAEASKEPDFAARATAFSAQTMAVTGPALAKLIDDEAKAWLAAAKAANLQKQ